jgi:hypothetical protein
MLIKRGSKQFLLPENRYYLPDEKHDEVLWIARISFLEAIQKHAPQVLLGLRDMVLSEFERNPRVPDCLVSGISAGEYLGLLKDRGLEDEIIYPWLTPRGPTVMGSAVSAWPTVQAVAEDLLPELMPTVNKMKEWAEKFCLTCVEKSSELRAPPEWVLNAAWGTILAWSRFPALRDQMSWHPPSLVSPPLAAAHGRWKFTLHFASYNPLVQSWKEYKRNFRSYVSSESRAFLERHKQKIEDEFRNWRRMPNQWQKQHCEWLVLFQINGCSPGQIAKNNNIPITEIAVLKAIHHAGGTIGLTPRPGRRGKGARRNMNPQ